MERGGLRIEAHTDPGTMRRSLPLLHRSLSFAALLTAPDLPPFVISTKVKQAIEI